MKITYTVWLAVSLLCVSVIGSRVAMAGVSSGASATGFTFTRNLAAGTRGDDVSALQQFLITGGFLKISTSTGHFGALTATALGRWQASVGISPAAGFFGPKSREAMSVAAGRTPVDMAPTRVTVATTTVIVGTTGVTIARVADGSPVRLAIPKLNINAGFQYNGLEPDGTMEVPSNIYDVGWFTGSVQPGEKGVAIVTGHVAQIRKSVVTKLGVFSDLGALNVGDTLSVVNDRGASTTFVVRAVRTYDPAADATDVFTSTDGGAHMNIITCEGVWNQAALSYTQRLVVFTEAVP